MLAGERIFFARGVRLEDPNAVLAFVSSVSANRGGLGATDWLQVRDDIAEDGEAAWITLAAMSVFVLLGSGVILANAAAAVAAGRSRDVALLKAIGATPLQVTGLLLGEMLVLGLGGALLGVAAGALTAPLFLREVAQLLDTTARPVVGPAGIVTIVLAVEALLLLFTAVPAWRSGRLSTVVALRGASAASEFAPSRLVGLASALRLPRGVAIGLKDLFARPARRLADRGRGRGRRGDRQRRADVRGDFREGVQRARVPRQQAVRGPRRAPARFAQRWRAEHERTAPAGAGRARGDVARPAGGRGASHRT